MRVQGLRELRRVVPELKPPLREVMRGAAKLVADEAASLAPYRTGRLAASIRGSTAGDRGIVRSALPYAAVYEYGDVRVRNRAGGRGLRYVGRAMEQKQEQVIEAIADGFDDVARRNGFH